MSVCCCYQKNDGSDRGCSTQAGPGCYTIPGYRLVSSSSGPCHHSEDMSDELRSLIAEAEAGAKDEKAGETSQS